MDVGGEEVRRIRPIRRTRRNDENAGSNHVRFVTPEFAFNADTNVAATGISSHLRLGLSVMPNPNRVRDQVRPVLVNNRVRNVTQALDRTDGDHVLARRGRKNRVGETRFGRCRSVAFVTGGEHIQHRLRTIGAGKASRTAAS